MIHVLFSVDAINNKKFIDYQVCLVTKSTANQETTSSNPVRRGDYPSIFVKYKNPFYFLRWYYWSIWEAIWQIPEKLSWIKWDWAKEDFKIDDQGIFRFKRSPKVNGKIHQLKDKQINGQDVEKAFHFNLAHRLSYKIKRFLYVSMVDM